MSNDRWLFVHFHPQLKVIMGTKILSVISVRVWSQREVCFSQSEDHKVCLQLKALIMLMIFIIMVPSVRYIYKIRKHQRPDLTKSHFYSYWYPSTFKSENAREIVCHHLSPSVPRGKTFRFVPKTVQNQERLLTGDMDILRITYEFCGMTDFSHCR